MVTISEQISTKEAERFALREQTTRRAALLQQISAEGKRSRAKEEQQRIQGGKVDALTQELARLRSIQSQVGAGAEFTGEVAKEASRLRSLQERRGQAELLRRAEARVVPQPVQPDIVQPTPTEIALGISLPAGLRGRPVSEVRREIEAAQIIPDVRREVTRPFLTVEAVREPEKVPTLISKGLRTIETRLETKGLRGEITVPERALGFGAGVALQVVSLPGRVFGLGKGLVTEPVETIKELPIGFIEFGREIGAGIASPTPEIAAGQIAGEAFLLRGTGKLFEAGTTKLPFRIKTPKPSEVVPKFQKPADITRTPLETTFPRELDLRGVEFEISPQQQLGLKRFVKEQPVEFEIPRELVREVEFARGVQEARFRTGADIIDIDPLGRPRIKEVVEPTPEGISIEFDPEFVGRLRREAQEPLRFDIGDTLKEPKAEGITIEPDPTFLRRVSRELREPVRFDIEDVIPKPPKPIEVGVDPAFLRRVKFELEQPKRFDIGDTLKEPKVPKEEAFFTFEEIKPPKIEGLKVRGRQQQLLRPPKEKLIDIKLEVKIEEPKVVTRDLVGIPRAIGGAGLTEAQLEQFGVQRTAQQVTSLQRQTQIDLGMGKIQPIGLEFERIPEQQFREVQAQRIVELDVLQTRLIEKPRVRERQVILPIPRQISRQIPREAQAFAFGELTFQPQVPIVGEKLVPILRERQFLVEEFAFPSFDIPFPTTFPPLIPPERKPRKRREEKVKRKARRPRVPIRPSFTGIVLEIEEAAIVDPRFGVLPGQIRGLATGFETPRRKKSKTKKTVKKSKKKKKSSSNFSV